MLSRVVGADVLDGPSVELAPHGRIADKIIHQLNDFYGNISVDRYVIMPNHVHLLLFVQAGGPSRTSAPTRQHSTVSRFVSTFKRFCNKEYGRNIWQRGFHDHIIRNREDYEEHVRYIYTNPTDWREDPFYSEVIL
ncbi:MAG: transposase [Clostridia bacterium]|nr:transposase [Clostridia bacterium]